MTTKILIIDDDSVVVYMLKLLVKETEINKEVYTFENGLLAIQFLKENYNKEDFFTIFLDIYMPVMNGWEFLMELSHFADPKNTSVCVVTSSTDKSEGLKALQNPLVSKFMVKPVYKENLLDFELLGERKSQKLGGS